MGEVSLFCSLSLKTVNFRLGLDCTSHQVIETGKSLYPLFYNRGGGESGQSTLVQLH